MRELEVGRVFGNYREVCAGLGEGVGSGRLKIRQVERWAKIFSWEREGNSWKITGWWGGGEAEVGGLTTAAGVSIGICRWLQEQIEKGNTLESAGIEQVAEAKKARSILLCEENTVRVVGLVNSVYQSKQFHPKNTQWDKAFFGDTRSIIKGFLRYSLRGLEDQKILKANSTYQLTRGEGKFRLATLEEHILVSDVYVETLNDLQTSNLQEVKAVNKIKEFYRKVNRKLLLEYDIRFHRSVWLITTSQSLLRGYFLKLRLSSEGLGAVKGVLNAKNTARLTKHFQKMYDNYLRHQNVLDKSMSLKDLTELPEDYLIDNLKRIEDFITLQSKS